MTDSEIYLYGMTLMTTSYLLSADFPQAAGYCEIAQSHRLPGGETGTCAVVLDSLGLTVQLDGNFLGCKTFPALQSYFAGSRVSLELMTCDPDFEGLEDIVFIDRHTRTGFGYFIEFYANPAVRRWNRANETAIRQAKVVGLDPFFLEESVEVARLCRRHKVRFVTVDCRADSEIHALADVNIISEEFLRNHYPGRDFEALFAEYAGQASGLVIFTFGADEVWFGRNGQPVSRFPPYRVEVQSTLGAGDSFKAGVIYALTNGMDDATLVRFGSATAAAACMNYPIGLNPPDLQKICRVADESFACTDENG